MNKISSRDIRLFVAGALALIGFQALIFIPYSITVSVNPVRMAGAIITGMALPMGIGIFVGRWPALFWAQIYLWLKLILGCLAIPMFWRFIHEKIGHLALRYGPEFVIAAILLAMLFWTTSERFRHEPEV